MYQFIFMWYSFYFYVYVYDVSIDNGNNMMDTIYLLYPCTYIRIYNIHYCVYVYIHMYVTIPCQCEDGHACVLQYNDPCLTDSTSTVVSRLIVRSQMT